jgi:hypothetical protein
VLRMLSVLDECNFGSMMFYQHWNLQQTLLCTLEDMNRAWF